MSPLARAGALVSLAFLSACTDTMADRAEHRVREPANGEAIDRAVVPDSLRDDFVRHGIAVAVDSRERTAAELGRPDSVSVRTMPNRYEPAKADSIVRLFYPGLEVEYIVVGPAPASEFLRSVVVSDNKFLKYPELGVGARPEFLTRALGAPWEQSDSTYTYDCGSCVGAETPVEFYVAEGRVRQIEFSYYVD